jgi:hypothetical protein
MMAPINHNERYSTASLSGLDFGSIPGIMEPWEVWLHFTIGCTQYLTKHTEKFSKRALASELNKYQENVSLIPLVRSKVRKKVARSTSHFSRWLRSGHEERIGTTSNSGKYWDRTGNFRSRDSAASLFLIG